MPLFYEDDIFSKQCTNLTYGPQKKKKRKKKKSNKKITKTNF